MRHATKTAHRFVRQADGSYTLDAAWRLADFPMGAGKYRPMGEFLSVDGYGYIYAMSGTWINTPPTGGQYAPDGTFVTRFGQYNAKSWAAGDFDGLAAGVAVSADGNSVYTAEVGNNRIEGFNRGSTARMRRR